MERVGAFISKLQEQYQQQADNATLLVTVQMLLTELQQTVQTNHTPKKVAVVMPHVPTVAVSPEPMPEEQPAPPQAPEIQQPAAPEVQPETQEPAEIPTETPSEMPQEQPEEIPSPSEPSTTTYGLRPTNPAFFMQEEAPTLAQQKKEVFELNTAEYGEEISLNDKLKVNNAPELASKLQEEPIRDLRKAININDRYQFISELFRGDETMYERSIKTINSFSVYQEANYWIQREMIYKLGWDDNNPVVKHFNQLVKRRFS
jgi:outer membrane biosynthesis protein TonB